MKYKDEKYEKAEKGSRVLPKTVLLIVLCGLSFYLGGLYCGKNKIEVSDVAKAESTSLDVDDSLQVKSVSFSECSSDYQDYTPCTDPRVNSICLFSGCVSA